MGRRVADRRRRGRREELPGGAPEEKQGDMKRWETGEDASAQQKGKDVVGVGLLTGCKFTGASWNILQPTTVNIPSFLPSFLHQTRGLSYLVQCWAVLSFWPEPGTGGGKGG
jgi:hypothetical protein